MSSRQNIEVAKHGSIDTAAGSNPLTSSQLNQTFGAKPDATNIASITTLDTLRDQMSVFDAYMQQLDEKIEYGFSNELEDDFEQRKLYKLQNHST